MQLVFEAAQELSFKEHDKSPSSFNRINYIELLEYRYTKKYDTVRRGLNSFFFWGGAENLMLWPF